MKSGLEIVIEPDVVPKGTFDPKSLDVAPARAAEVSALLTSAVVNEAREAARSASASSGADSDSKAATVPPPGVTAVGEDLIIPIEAHEPVPELSLADREPAKEPAFIALEAAANAPMPPRPASATSGPDAAKPALAGAFDGTDPFDTSIGSGASLAFEATRLLVVLLVLATFLGWLWLHLTGTLGASDVAADVDTTPVTPTPTTIEVPTLPVDEPPVDAPTDVEAPADAPPTDEPPADEPPADEPPADEPPADEPPADEPSDEETAAEREARLQKLREVAGAAATGGEVGIEEDEPGLLATIERLRKEAVAILGKGGDLELAAMALREILKRAPRDADALFRLGLVLHRLDKPSEAEDHYRKAATEAPSDPRPWNNLSVLQLQAGNSKGSQESLGKALQLDPENPSVLTNLANLIGRDRPEQAHPLYDKALAQEPAHEESRLGRARIRERLGDTVGARADYKVLVEAKSRLKPEAYDGLGRLASKQRKYEQAIAYHRKAFEERGDALPGARVELGVALTNAGHTLQAIKVLEEATAAEPDNPRAWLTLGIAYSKRSEDRPNVLYQAKKAYEKALALRADWHGHFNYALCAERFGNFPVAILHYEKAIKADPKAWPAYANLARLYEQANRPERALAFLERALEATPEAADVHLHKAHLLASMDRGLEARASLRRFVELAPRDDPRLEDIRKGLEPKSGR